ncbi:MAG TPA: PhzF family phenazine biosynthesis protein [Kribbella sp.]|nr:PhzF family phenazine biosynthesis protein [Kribbella sp.]
MTTVEVDVLRVFTDPEGRFGNPLGVIDGAAVPIDRRMQVAASLGFSETVFIDDRASGRIQIFTATSEMRFAGHPTVGTAWWLRSHGYDAPVLHVPAGEVAVTRSGDLTSVLAHAEWGSTFEWHQLESPAAVMAVDPASYSADHDYVWAWTDEEAGAVRSRMFAPVMGVVEDEATGSAAVALTSRLGRDLVITQGAGSQISTTFEGDGWATVGGRVTHETRHTISLPR